MSELNLINVSSAVNNLDNKKADKTSVSSVLTPLSKSVASNTSDIVTNKEAINSNTNQIKALTSNPIPFKMLTNYISPKMQMQLQVDINGYNNTDLNTLMNEYLTKIPDPPESLTGKVQLEFSISVYGNDWSNCYSQFTLPIIGGISDTGTIYTDAVDTSKMNDTLSNQLSSNGNLYTVLSYAVASNNLWISNISLSYRPVDSNVTGGLL